MTHTDWVECAAILASAYPKESMNRAQTLLYGAMLSQVSAASCQQAVVEHVAESPWFPRISELLDRLASVGLPDADEAWSEVRRQMSRVGYCGTPTWSHPAIAGTVQALGWRELCVSENPEADRAHFIKFYSLARQRAIRQRAAVDALPQAVRRALAPIGIEGDPHG